ncbi:eukaryotic translation initiation factor 3 subunit 6 interacting protein [Cardiosporidium cionae]|uniref:Eukaryotic translation initiation factor 3 subunit L n=1 Tax=Cardiosporidium cionae TaxID=476202 RepID=A0ABQ7JA42_9APIC|nr:eukaryotic translation initiation factor 3 subunit 6 interacting protein [Cardiosporidium cionae]|eukprot:KAF8820854.1 eukaryotic translation initiation factor 3 subunit 6 interacting protein [Cardiosporidium cionae]
MDTFSSSAPSFADGGAGNPTAYQVGPANRSAALGQSKVPFVIPNHTLSVEVATFLWNLYVRVVERDLDGLRRLYEHDYSSLSEQQFSNKSWPDVSLVVDFYKQNGRYHNLFEAFYKELSYRHLFSKCRDAVTAEDRRFSWENYTMLFTYFTEEECGHRSEDGTSGLVLPSQWIWDMHDEFVYQLHDTCRWKSSLARHLPELESEQNSIILQIKEAQEIWSAAHIFQFLHQIVETSGIREFLRRNKGDVGRSTQTNLELRFQLGYFSMVALLRLYTLVGEYTLAIEAVAEIEISPRCFHTTVLSCHTTFVYYLAFAYMMLRRYHDAIRVLSQFLIHIGKQRNVSISLPRPNNQILKQADRMYLLLMLCDILSTTRLDDYLMQVIRERYTDKYNKLQLDAPDVIQEIFNIAKPKIINPAFMSFENKEALLEYAEVENEKNERPLLCFLKEAQHKRKVMEIHSFAKLYNNIQLSKLASLMEIKGRAPSESMQAEILSLKHKSRQYIWKSGSLLSGDSVSLTPTFDFYLDCDIIHVKNQKTQRLYAEDFLKCLVRSQELSSRIQGSSSSRPSKDRDNTD